MARRFSPGLVLFLVVSGCDCGGGSEPDGGTSPDGAQTDGDLPDGPLPDGPLPDGPCVPNGGSCGTASECCSDNCDRRLCVPEGCLDPGIACTGDDDCCSGVCNGGTCAPRSDCATFGMPCTAGGDCCSSICANMAGIDCGATDTGCACSPNIECRAGGDPCMEDMDCCNGLCDRPGGAAMGSCALFGACRTAGEPCGTEGLSGDCCSTVCLATGGGTVPRCQFLGGCRVQDDLCANDGECCSGVCEVAGMTADGREIRRCANADSCLPTGEVCGFGGASSNCCPNGGGRMGCMETTGGFSRCFGGGEGCCVVATLPCEVGGECPCCGEPPGLVCTEGTPRGTICCLPDGSECEFGDLCCGGVCAPDAMGVRRCDSSCVLPGGACGSDAECCDCCRDGVCTEDCGGCTGPMLGDLCDPDGEPCCDAPAIVCSDSEFPTCVLAP